MTYEEDYDPSERRWMKKLMRDPFQLLLKKVRAGEFITPAFFHKCTIPHSYHCFKRYHFRPDPFAWYMRKHKIPLRAPTAAQLHKMTLSALSRMAKTRGTGVSPVINHDAPLSPVINRDAPVSPVINRDAPVSPAVIRGTGVSPVINHDAPLSPAVIRATGVSPVDNHTIAANGHSEPRPQVVREESTLFKSPSEFSVLSVAKNNILPRQSAESAVEIENRKLEIENPSPQSSGPRACPGADEQSRRLESDLAPGVNLRKQTTRPHFVPFILGAAEDEWNGHSEPAARQREESNLFKSPAEFSFSSVAKNFPCPSEPERSFRVSADRPSREICSNSTAKPSQSLQIENRKLKIENPKLSSVAKPDFVKSKPKLANYKTFFAEVPDT